MADAPPGVAWKELEEPIVPHSVEGERYASGPGAVAPSGPAPGEEPPEAAVGLKDVADAERGTAVSLEGAGSVPSVGVVAIALD